MSLRLEQSCRGTLSRLIHSVNYSANSSHSLNADTREEQLKPFDSQATLGKRNYCVIKATGDDDALEFVILAENDEMGGDSIPYPLVVPAIPI
jgi:hypothetical protein